MSSFEKNCAILVGWHCLNISQKILKKSIVFNFQFDLITLASKDVHSVYPSPLSAGGGGELSLQPNFQKEGLTGPQVLEGAAGKEGMTFFSGGCNFHIKNKLKSEIFKDKKGLIAKKKFSVTTKNSNREILPKNLVTFKR